MVKNMSLKAKYTNFAESSEQKSKSFCVSVSGQLAMFGTPTSKQNCEMISYPMPTYSSLCGMMNHIYYRPGIKWVIEKCRVMKEIKYQEIPIKTPHYREKSERQSKNVRIFNYSFLSDVEYQIRAHYVIDKSFINDTHGYCAFVHDDEIEKSITDGPERIVSLGKGTTGIAIVRPCEWGEGSSFYDNHGISESIVMFHSFLFDKKDWERKITDVGFCRQFMNEGIVDFEKMPVRYQKREILRRNGA